MSLSNIKNTSLVDLSKHHTVFCDSIQALEWAYQSGLPESAIIKSSAPSLLWSKNPSIKNIEERWSVDEITKFQGTIKSLVEDIFDLALNIPGIER